MTRMEAQTVSSIQLLPRLAYSLAESEALSGLSRSSLYRLIIAGKLQTVRRGRRRLVPSAELNRLCGVDANHFYRLAAKLPPIVGSRLGVQPEAGEN